MTQFEVKTATKMKKVAAQLKKERENAEADRLAALDKAKAMDKPVVILPEEMTGRQLKAHKRAQARAEKQAVKDAAKAAKAAARAAKKLSKEVDAACKEADVMQLREQLAVISAEKLQPGQSVIIYKDPMTCNLLEGEAVLIKRIISRDEDGFEFWAVAFKGDEGCKCERVINLNNH